MFVRQPLRLVCLAFAILPGLCFAEEFIGRVVGVPDGDDVLIVSDGLTFDVRFNGIDCPEKGQAYGRRATQFTSDHTLGKDILVRTYGLDRYGRTIGDVLLSDGANLNRELVKAGLCWWYRKYATNDSVLAALEMEAREAKLGLWAEPEPLPPWEFRHRQRRP
jgi:endonuclease YncB( thermonuclease family)